MSGRPDVARGIRCLVGVGIIVLGGTGCEAGPSEGMGRPDDGLLERPELQEVVELQSRRDGRALMALLDDSDPAVRARAAFALGSVQEPEARDALVGLLEDPEAGVRGDAAFALGQLGDSTAGGSILEALEAEVDADVRVALWHALGKAGDSTALAAVEVRDLDVEEAATAALALARFGMRGIHDERKIRWLAESITSESEPLRTNAAYYFGRTPDPAVWLSQIHRVRAALDSYERADPAAMYLLRGLGNLGRLVDAKRMVVWLEEAEDWRIRAEAARAIGVKLGMAPPVWVPLLRALDDPSRHVAVAAAEVVANNLQPLPGSVEHLKGWVDAHPDDWRVAGPLVVALAMHGESDFVETWLDRWSTDEVGPWAAGLEALSYLGGEGVVRRLVEATRSQSPRVAGAAAEALARRWEDDRFFPRTHRVYYEAFRDALETEDLRAVVAVAPVLADTIFRPFGSVEVLMGVYRRMAMPEDVEAMGAILSALGEAGDPEAIALLRDASDHSHAVIRQGARDALAALRDEEEKGGMVTDDRDGESGAPADSQGRAMGEAPGPESRPDWVLLRDVGAHPRLVLETARGRIAVELDAEEAPVTVQTMARLAREGRLDGVPFHRVVPNFVIQGGDFERGDGFGGPGFSIPSEFTRVAFRTGTIGMASAGKDTEGSQYFITHSMQPHLDGRYTAFGRVVEGMDVVNRILRGDEVTRAAVEPGG